MIVLGIILIVISWLIGIKLLLDLGILLLVVGLVLLVLGGVGRPVGGRRYWY